MLQQCTDRLAYLSRSLVSHNQPQSI